VLLHEVEVVFLFEEVIGLGGPRGGLERLEEPVFVAEAVAGVAAVGVDLGMCAGLLEHADVSRLLVLHQVDSSFASLL
jgi:hypothetical protein